ncbi:MAG: RNA polymerase-binding protein DksA [Proteobacteria bacterium]|nr:RNA polymerase-binding protein DksA [Pseudomonadota bacterium]
MTPEEVEYFKIKLEEMQRQIYDESGETVEQMKKRNKEFPDPGDRAHLESESITTLRIRDRERKLLKKIQEALQRLEDGEYNVCEECEELIRKERLDARPVTTLCFNCKEKEEQMEKTQHS